MTEPIIIRAPTTNPPNFRAPTSSELLGLWHVTHSSLPLWKSKRNVTVTYGALEPTSSSGTVQDRLDDIVSYQTLTSDKIKTIHGIDTAEVGHPGVYNWRGSGWLKVASSHWEILAHGRYEEREWAVTYFAATVFSSAGVDIYSREKKALPNAVVEAVKEALKGMVDPALRKLGEDLYEVRMD